MKSNSILSLALFVLCLLSVTQTRAEKPTDSAPNILFIAVDDLRPELGIYGTKTKTPNVDQFAKTGVRFDRAYCQQSVCGASRLSIMSGLYPTRTREHSFHVTDWRKRHPDVVTLNQHFVASGYNTIGLGKIYHLTKGPEVDADNWTQWIDLGRDDLYALPENKAGLEAYRKATAAGDKLTVRGPLTEIADVPDDAYIDGRRAAEAEKVLTRLGELHHRQDGEAKPFFLAIGFTKPHLPFVAPKKYWDLYQRDDFKMPSNTAIPPGYLEAAAKLGATEMNKYKGYGDNGPADFSDELNKQLLHGYAASTSYADANIGVVLNALQENGLAENTIVVFWGDHGWKLGDHSSWCKQTNFECDTRVPLIVRVPEQLADHTTNGLVELIDLYPTLCELAKIKTPPHCQGKSFASLLQNKNAQHRDCAYSVYPTVEKQTGHSIRFGDYRYTQWRKNENGTQAIAGVLTDLKNDPGEVTNVAQDESHAEMLKQGKTLLDQRISDAVSEKSETD